jgi:hypothetical protein
MSRWRKNPIVVDAWQFMPAGQREEPPPWIDRRWFHEGSAPKEAPHMLIPTPEGTLRAEHRDWIIKGVKGEVYPCKPDIFAKTYVRES